MGSNIRKSEDRREAGAMRLDPTLLLGFLLSTLCFSASTAIAGVSGGRSRSLLSFVEAQGNASYRCTPSGPCLPCQYSEKNEEKYRCSETVYHLPLKCTIQLEENKEDNKNMSKLMDESSSESSNSDVKQYITYRSCVPVESEEILSFLGFEVMMVGLLLISGPFVYLRQKRTTIAQEVVRISSNSPPRF